ncbi:MAG TPA: ribonuclease D [Thermoanaerobaculia bacterium]|jgi:ribonuclease D
MSSIALIYEPITTRSTDLSAEAAARFAESPVLACDIETSGLDWRTERIATVQLYAPGQPISIVRANGKPPKRLLELLAAPHIVKVFHHAMFDLRFMARQWDAAAQNVHCTKIAAKLLHPDAPEKQSLRALVDAYLNVSLDKSQQISNWETKRLTRRQQQYAANDVAHLPALLARLQAELVARDLWTLAESCFAHIPARVALEVRGFGDVYTY